MSERSALIDILKGVCITFIVIGHAKSISTLHIFIGFLFLFHVPVFFFISGLTLNSDAKLAKNIDRVISISLAYFVLSFLAIPKWWIYYHSFDFIAYARGVLYGTGHTIVITPIWFLTCLSLSILIASVILKTINSKKLLLVVSLLFMCVGAYFLNQQNYSFDDKIGWGNVHNSGYIWNFDIAILGSGFVLFGCLLRDYISRVSSLHSELINFILLVSVTTFLYIYYFIKVDLNFRVFEPWYLAIFSALTGTGSIIFLSRLINKNNPLSKIFVIVGQSSLMILFLHRDIQIIITKILMKFCPSEVTNINLFTILGMFIFPIVLPIIIDLLVIRRFKLLSMMIYPRPRFLQR